MYTLKEIAAQTGLHCPEGQESLEITGVAGIEAAGKTEITFFNKPKYKSHLADSTAAVVIVAEKYADWVPNSIPKIIVSDPYPYLPKLLGLFERKSKFPAGISALAQVAASAKIAASAVIGPYVTIADDVVIGENCEIQAHCTIGEGVEIGANCKFHARVTVYHDCQIGPNTIVHSGAVIGSDGFGFAPTENGIEKIPQIGNVVIGSNVEIGANTTIDRATMGSTTIGNFVKLDNLIQIAHNVHIGDYTVIAAQTGIAGSTKVGQGCMIGGQVGIVGHLEIGDGVQIAAQAGIVQDVASGQTIAGSPAIPISQWRRVALTINQLPEKLKDLQDKVKKLSA